MSARQPRRGSDPATIAISPTAAPPTGPSFAREPESLVDPRAVRVVLGATSARDGVDPIVVSPPAVPLAPSPRLAGIGVLGGVADSAVPLSIADPPGEAVVVIDGEARRLRLERYGRGHVALVDGESGARTVAMILADDRATATAGGGTVGTRAPGGDGVERREIVVDGWRFEVEIESERRASLRERARRGREETARGGPTEVHAIIPGVVVSVSVVPGDAVVAGQQLLVVEAMKMQNELRAPRDGVISRVAVGAGRTIEVGDLLLVLA